MDRAAVEAVLDTGGRGLDPAEAAARRRRHGPNQLEEVPPPSVLGILLHQFASPLIYILLLAAAVTLVLGHHVDAGVIAAALALNAVIGFVQERRAELAVRALMGLLAPRARVLRGGHEREVDSRELVPGDLVLLESGARVPADLRLAGVTALRVDESLLTGESVPVVKEAGPLEGAERALADRANMAYAGTIVSSGRGRGYVVATGEATELGAIAAQVRGRQRAVTPLQARMARFGRLVGVVVALGALATFALGWARGDRAADMFLVAVALAVSVVPEGLPVVFTVTLALGVRRMARRHAIVRRLPAVETLGSTTVIGSDKTGTLTANRMTVEQVWAGSRFFDVPDNDGPDRLRGGAAWPWEAPTPLSLTLLAGVLTNEAQAALTDEGWHTQGDPTEAALLVAAARLGVEPAEARQAHALHAEIPFEPERRYSASIRERDGRYQVFVKGAPERLLEMSARMQGEPGPAPLDAEAVLAAARTLASRGLRVLGMACGELDGAPDPRGGLADPDGLVFLGLQGFRDPPRAGVREAVAGCQESGIRVIMITGDHAETARAIAAELGIAPAGAPVLTGAELSALDDEALARRVAEVSVYARVSPEHKLRVVQALQRRGEVVAVTGDGVNDAPALRAADIGVAMGRGGTDVAREAADMVLTDDNFVSIYAAVEEGRVTFDNLRKVTFFLISTGAALLAAILATVGLGWPLPMRPAQLLWLNLVTNGLQDVALAFEPGDPGVLRRPPRPRAEGIISRLLWERTALAGLVMAGGTVGLFGWELARGAELGQAQTVALTTMVMFQVFHVGNARSERRSLLSLSPLSNPFLFAATAGALGVHVAALYLPWTQFVLRVEPIGRDAWWRILVTAGSILAAVEADKLVRRRLDGPARSVSRRSPGSSAPGRAGRSPGA
jgi:Ca2+-transporting ATPase